MASPDKHRARLQDRRGAHTLRRGKLGLYESWGFPEVWVEVDQTAPSRPRNRRPGLTIYLLEDGAYRTAPESRAFPGWTAEEIHVALNEPRLSERTSAVLERVGTMLGEREGTGPDHDPLLRSHRRREFERGIEHGMERGRVEDLYRLAALRFGQDTARQLAALLASADPDRLARAGSGVIECRTGPELLDLEPGRTRAGSDRPVEAAIDDGTAAIRWTPRAPAGTLSGR